VATRLGYIGSEFITPYEEEQQNGVKLLNLDHGKQKIIDAFHSKGNINNYINGLFKHINDMKQSKEIKTYKDFITKK